MKAGVLAGVLVFAAFTVSGQQQQQQQSIPDGPTPQTLPGASSVTPGIGASSTKDPGETAPSTPSSAPQQAPQTADEQTPPEGTEPGQGLKAFTLRRVDVNFVEIPFTVKDNKGTLVPGLLWRDIRVFENNSRQHIMNFTSDPIPLSVALVIDQSLPFNVMDRVNNALGTISGVFAPYDEIAVFTYNNGPRLRTDFTGARSNRLTAVIEQSKSTGREPVMGIGGPLSQNIFENGKQFDPNTSVRRNSNSPTMIVPKETHTLNDAIFAAAESLSKRPSGRHRVIFVVSDGKEYGSTAKMKDVIKYLQVNQIAVYATLTGDSAVWGIGWLDKYHLPYMMRDNNLPQYVAATGGQAISSYRQREIENAFSRIAESAGSQYTIGYYSHEPFIDGKYRSVEVQVLRPNLTVISKPGYYPPPAPMHSAPSPAK